MKELKPRISNLNPNPKFQTVNWGNKRLLPNESLVSFISKFSHINGLNFKETKRFFVKQNLFEWTSAGLRNIDYHGIAQLLDEDYEVVHMLHGSYLDLIVCYGGGHDGMAADEVLARDRDSYQLKYCPECMRNGYHSSMHEYHWLSNCPIHPKIPLHVEREYPIRNFQSFVEYCKDFTNEINRICPRWLSIKQCEFIHENVFNDDYFCFKDWVLKCQSISICINKSVVINHMECGYSIDTFGEYLQRINWKYPIPKKILAILGFKIKGNCCPSETIYTDSVTSTLNTIINRLPFEDFRSFYCKHLALSKDEADFRYLAEEIASVLNRHIINCNCRWYLNEISCWEELKGESVSENKNLQCPYICLREILLSDWLDFRNYKTSKLQFQSWHDYRAIAIELSDIGIFEITLPKLVNPEFLPIGKFTFSSSCKHNLDQILELLLYDYISQSTSWIKYIKEGYAPFNVPKILNKVGFFSNGKSIYSLKW